MIKKSIAIFVSVCLLTIGTFVLPVVADDDLHGRCFGKNRIKVMTRNLYLGADIFKVLQAAQNPDPALDGLDVPIAVANLFQIVQYTNFPERAEALANEVMVHRPHFIGLQEVSIWYIQTPGDMALGGTEPASNVVYDYLEIFLSALANRGLHYTVAVSSENYETNPEYDSPFNADVELPMLTGFTMIEGFDKPVPTFDDVRMVDRDVILVRADIDTSNPIAAPYEFNVSETIGGVSLEFTRCWTAVDANICGEKYRFVNTHLEINTEEDPESGFRKIQALQMAELLKKLSYETLPIILVGDFNSSPEHPISCGILPDGTDCISPYIQAMDADYLDAWELIMWPRDGFTSGYDELINDPDGELFERIDHIFILPGDREIKRVAAMTTGDHVFNMTPSGLRPSDHAGVVARIVFERDD